MGFVYASSIEADLVGVFILVFGQELPVHQEL